MIRVFDHLVKLHKDRREMKLLYLLPLLSCVSAPALAGDLDLAKLSCATYTAKIEASPPGSENRRFVDDLNFWLHGYATGKSGSTLVSDDDARTFVRQLSTQCVAHPEQSVAQAVDAVIDERRTASP
jgi:hypothetical protein